MSRTEPTIANYDAQSADEITQRLRKLSQADLGKLETYERQGEGRSTVLERIAALRGDPPWPGYDEMEVEEVNDALKQRDGDMAGRVLDYERRHKERTTVIDFAKRRQAADDEPSTARGAGGAAGSSSSRSSPRSSSRSSSRAKGSARKSTPARKGSSARKPASASSGRASASSGRASASSGRASASKSGARSTGGRSGKPSSTRTRKPSSTRTRAKSASRPTAARSSRSRSGSSRAGRSKSASSGASASRGASRSRAQARSSSGGRSGRSGSRGSARAAKTAPARVKQRVTGTLRSAEARTEKLAKGGRDAVGDAAKGAGQAVGTAANKAKGPALMGGAVLAALGGGVALGHASGLLRKRKRVLGVPIGRRTAVGKAAKRVGHAVDGLGATGHQLGQWSDDLQDLRQRVTRKAPIEKLTDGASPLQKLT